MTTYTVTFATDPTGVGADVAWRWELNEGSSAIAVAVASGTTNTGDSVNYIEVPTGAVLRYELALTSGIHVFHHSHPMGLAIVDSSMTITGFYSSYEKLTTGLGVGFWSSKNGQALLVSGFPSKAELAKTLNEMNLVDDKGKPVTFVADNVYKQFTTWISARTAKNMSCMLSTQLASMKLAIVADRADRVLETDVARWCSMRRPCSGSSQTYRRATAKGACLSA